MDYFIICFAALIGSGLTLFSGFGLGTLLVPVFGLFFPIEIAILLTAVVHFLNNIFKLVLLGKYANITVVIRFGLPALFFAFLGASLLSHLANLQPLAEYSLLEHHYQIMPIKLIIGFLLLFFSLIELIPKLSHLQFDQKYLPIGGILSGFFGGLSGNQGALRAAFLIRAGLTKQSYIATGVVIACLIDVSRLSIYTQELVSEKLLQNAALLACATIAAFAGTFIGNKLITKVTLSKIQNLVGLFLILFSVLLILGIL